MSGLKEFLVIEMLKIYGRDSQTQAYCDRMRNSLIHDLGLFFWERGGKEHAKVYLKHEKTIEGKIGDFSYADAEAQWLCEFENENQERHTGEQVCNAKDWLDCVACLGEDKVKELIKELEK